MTPPEIQSVAVADYKQQPPLDAERTLADSGAAAVDAVADHKEPPLDAETLAKRAGDARALAQIDTVVTAANHTCEKIARFSAQRQRCLLQMATLVWRRRLLPPAQAAARAKELLARSNRLAYDAGCMAEALLRSVFKLDECFGSNAVRTARKAAVKTLHSLIARCDALREQSLSLSAAFQPRLSPLVARIEAVPPSPLCPSPPPLSPPMAAATAAAAAAAPPTATPRPAVAPPAPTPPKTPVVAAATPRTPAVRRRFRPSFEQHRLEEAVVLSAALPGVGKDDLTIAMAPGRQLRVSGSRRVRRRVPTQPRPHRRQPRFNGWMFGFEPVFPQEPAPELVEREEEEWFEETFTIPEALAVEEARMILKDGILRIVLPHADEEEEEEEEVYSHPYYRRRCAPRPARRAHYGQPAPRYRPAERNPYFGGAHYGGVRSPFGFGW